MAGSLFLAKPSPYILPGGQGARFLGPRGGQMSFCSGEAMQGGGEGNQGGRS